MRLVDADVGPYERVVWATDDESGLRAIVAVHSTALGPAVGGCRFHPYADEATAMMDALRLAAGMTLKSAAAGLHLGGGKSVIIGDPARDKTPELLMAFGRVVDSLSGVYLTAEDVGTTAADMDVIHEETEFVLGLTTSRFGLGGDPSPFTSRGVVAAMRAAWCAEQGSGDLADARVVVQGVGKVGSGVARLAAQEGAEVAVADVDAARAASLATEIGARALPAEGVLTTPCDILAPCALGGVLNDATVPALACGVVCGAANNQLADAGVADLLASRGIAYVPDFIANAGGIIAIAHEMDDWDIERVLAAVDGIGDTVLELIEEARIEGGGTLEAARRRAEERIALAGAR
ncbi:MAG TPA: Glu/Leu/Phe/Val dehydrogenase dimerization domain-containing protein [Miltoncostaeaceae bacterium]|nr:Glu/Leu/Phe/Val dehydrogenase dimerization domain-containing protein [Miltoncostaeaceae bacterium]